MEQGGYGTSASDQYSHQINELRRRLGRSYPWHYAGYGDAVPAISLESRIRVRARYGGILEFVDARGVAVSRTVGQGHEDIDSYGADRFGAVPASEAEIAGLPEATPGEVREKSCAVCLESFEEGEALRKMTCPSSHAFHEGCILKWLGVSRICPLCRFALPAEDGQEEEDNDEPRSEDETDEEVDETDTHDDACTGTNGQRSEEASTGSCGTSTEPAEEEVAL